MPTYDATIGTLVSGDFRQVPWQISNVPMSGAVTQAWLTVKESAADPDIELVVQKIITEVLDTSQGQITNTGSIGNVATGFFNLLAVDTILLTPGTTYAYDIQVLIEMTDTTTRIETPEIGTIETIDGVTDATE